MQLHPLDQSIVLLAIYRQDMPNVVMVIREFRTLLEKLKSAQEKDVKDNSST